MMKKFHWKPLLPHLIAVIVFALVAMVYCKPALFDGKVLQQSDVSQWKGMSKNMQDYKDKHGNWPLWTNGMFSGMPTYQIALGADNPVSVTYVQSALTLFFSKPANYFFLASLCFYFLALVLRSNPYVAIIGGLAYAYATYNPVIIIAGHDTKMMAIAYLPALIGSLILIFEKKYLWGAALTALFGALLIGANHLQITYYTLIIVLFLTLGYAVHWIKQKDFRHLFTAFGIAAGSAILAVLVNIVMLATTYEYSKATIRNGSALASGADNITKTGMSKEYNLSYSVYKTEPLVMMFPYLYGGSSGNMEIDQEKSKGVEALQQMPPQLAQNIQDDVRFYWGGIDGVGTQGPPYIGAIICFLALIGFVLLDGKHKWWILAATILTLFMSWGKYFDGFNSFLLDHLPMYNKFRAPSMILVVPGLLLCMMAVMSLQKIISAENRVELWEKYKKGLLIVAGIFVVGLMVYATADFTSQGDKNLLKIVNSASEAQRAGIEQPIHKFLSGMVEDRKDLATGTFLRSLFFMAVAGLAIWLFIKKKVNSTVVLVTIGLLTFVDLILIDNKYLNSENYQEDNEMETVFKPSPADAVILKDTSFYRVFNVAHGVGNAFNGDALNAYYHNAIGGYHPAKLSIYQDLIERQFDSFPRCMPVLNMLNTKYILQGNLATDTIPNKGALGNCWFVKGIQYTDSPAAAMNALTYFNPRDTAIVDTKFKSQIHTSDDSTARISLVKNDNDFIEYHALSKTDQYAVFSEIYYAAGWKAYIDGKESAIIPTNYALRGVEIPAGDHKVTFEFKPASFYTSIKMMIIASAIIWLLLIGAIVQNIRGRLKQKSPGA